MDIYHNLRDLRMPVLVSLIIAGIIMIMILYFIAIQYKNDYIMQVFMHVFCEIDYYICILVCPTDDACIYAFSLCFMC